MFSVGTIHRTNEGYDVEIISNNGWKDILVRFECGYTTIVNSSNLKKGKVSNPYHKSVSGVGYFGEGTYSSTRADGTRKKTKTYEKWVHMIRRCYDNDEKYRLYSDCMVDSRWHNFQNFANDCEKLGYDKLFELGYEIDKDLLSNGNKIYSIDTVIPLPQCVNSFLANRLDGKNTSGATGVCKNDRYKKKWIARLYFDGKEIFNERFEDFNDAVIAYNNKRSEIANVYKNILRNDKNYSYDENVINNIY